MQYALVNVIDLQSLIAKVDKLEKEVAKMQGRVTSDICKMPEAETILKVSAKEIRKMVAKGEIKQAEQKGDRGDWFFCRSELIRIANSIFDNK